MGSGPLLAGPLSQCQDEVFLGLLTVRQLSPPLIDKARSDCAPDESDRVSRPLINVMLDGESDKDSAGSDRTLTPMRGVFGHGGEVGDTPNDRSDLSL